MQSIYLKKALAIVLAWLPTLFWLVFAATGVILGVGGLFSSEPIGALIFIALGVGGILGFLGLTVVCWTRKPVTGTLAVFLACGVLSLLIASGYLLVGDNSSLTDPETLLKLVYFVVFPVSYACYRIYGYFMAASDSHHRR